MTISSNIPNPIDGLKSQIDLYLTNKNHLSDVDFGVLHSKIESIARTASSSLKDDLEMLDHILMNLNRNTNLIDETVLNEVDQKLKEISIAWSEMIRGQPISDSFVDLVESAKVDLLIREIESGHYRKGQFNHLDIQAILKKIRDSGIESQHSLVRIAKFIAALDTFPRQISDYIKEFKITDQRERVNIAKIEAKTMGLYIRSRIQAYEITDPDTLFEIAKITAANFGKTTADCFPDFGISDPEKSFTIAKIAIEESGQLTPAQLVTLGLCYYDSEYKLIAYDPNKVFELLKIVAARYGRAACDDFKDFREILNQDQAYEIAKIVAALDGSRVGRYFNNYGITNQDYAFEIAKIAVRQYKDAIYYIKNFNLSTRQCVVVFVIAFADHTQLLNNTYFRLPSKGLFSDWQSISLSEWQGKFEKKWPGLFKGVFEEINTLDESEDKEKLKNARLWLFLTAVYLDEKVPVVQDQSLLKSIYKYADPTMRFELSSLATEMFFDQEKYKVYSALLEGKNKKPIEHLRLPLLYLSQLQNPQIRANLKELIQKERSFREGPRLKVLIDNLHQLQTVDWQLSNQDISILLTNAVSSKDKNKIKNNLFTITAIIACDGIDDLKLALRQENFDLSKTYLTVFKRVIDVGEIDDFANKYERTFGSSTFPSSLLIYAKRLHKLPEDDKKKALSLLITFVRSVLEGTYAQERYTTQYSNHLATVFTGDLERLWRENIKEELKIDEKEKGEVVIDYKEFLTTNIITHNHLDKNDHDFKPIIEYLQSGNGSIRESLSLTIESQENRDPKLLLQLNLIDLVMGKKEAKKLLKEIEILLEKMPYELINDIKGLTKEKSLRVPKKLTLENTDDFDALLNSGTHVTGSCQRVDGAPIFNKCLLSYLMDGKNRILAIRDEKGFIVARSIFRLLQNQKSKKAVLFQERIYPYPLEAKFEGALKQFAIKEANRLGLPLYTTGDEDVTIESLGGRAPWEYVDAVGGVHQDSLYTITKGKKVEADIIIHHSLSATALRVLAESIPVIHRSNEWSHYDRLVTMALNEEPENFLMASHGDEVVGYAYVPKKDENTHSVNWIAVNQKMQGKGVGARLMLKAIDNIKALGSRRLIFHFRANSPGLEDFYEKVGKRARVVTQITSAGFYSNRDPRAEMTYKIDEQVK